MNNTKRKIFTGVIAAVVCFTMILGSFGAIIGAAFGILSNEDLINAINNGSISVGDLALLASLEAGNLTIKGQDVTNVAKDGYRKKENSAEIGDKKTDYDTYNKPYYTAGVTSTSTTATIGDIEYTVKYAPESSYFGGTDITTDLEDAGVSGNLLIYCDISMRHGASAKTNDESVIVVKENANLVIAMATPEEILDQTPANIGRIQLNSAVFADGLLGSKTVYGICLNRCYFDLKAGASLTLLGRDFNGNGYIDDVPVEITVNNAQYWFYEKIVLSGSSAYQDYDPVVGKALNGGQEVFDNKDGITRPLISVYGGTDGSGTSAKLIISGADLRNNFNEKVPTIPSGTDPGFVDDVNTGGGAIYLASGSKHNVGRGEETGGWFKEVIITNTRFAYCGAVRGGAIMVGKNFYSSTLDLSYCDYDHCYTAYYNYNSDLSIITHGTSEQSGDGGAVCFYQDETTTENWNRINNHNNPSLIYAGTVDFTGSTFSFCYAMRMGGAIHFGGYHYNQSDLDGEASSGFFTNASGFVGQSEMLGTRIGTLKIDFCDFYCCGAGWAMKAAPGISDSSFIFTSKVNKVSASGLFAGLEGVTDYVTAKNPGGANLFTEINPWGNSYPGLQDLQWIRDYDDYTGTWLDPNTDPRNLHNWYNIPQMLFAGPCREGGAIFFNCRVQEMSMKDCTFIYCAADSNGGAVFLDDHFVCPSAIVENCLFKNNMSNESTGKGSDTGTFRSTGLAAADIHFNNCSFLYNINFGGGGALYLNLNNTYTSPKAGDTTYNVAKPENHPTTQRNKDRCAGSEVNNCLFFGNFAIWSGAAIRCTGVMDINSSTFAHNISNNGSAGAIYFLTYVRDYIDVGTEKAQMRFDMQYDPSFDGHTIVCYNEVGGTGSGGGGGIAISATHSPSVGIPDTEVTSTDSAKTYKSRQYSFDFALNGVLVFNNTASGGGGGIYFSVDNAAAGADSVVNARVYDKNVDLNDGYVFSNYAYGVGGGVRVRDEVSVRKGATKVAISGANVYDNESVGDGGGLYILAEGGTVNIEGGCVVDNKAPNGAGIYIKDTNTVNITGGHVGISNYGAPTLTRGATDTTFTDAASANLAGGNVASVNGGGIFIENSFTDETYFDNDTTVTMTGGIIEANDAEAGGGLFMKRGSTAEFGYVNFTMNPSSGDSAYGFYGNTATSGAGIYADSGNTSEDPEPQIDAQRYVVNLNGGEVTANVANKYGGGAFITAGAKLVVNGGIMDSNKADTLNGGAVYINNEASEAVISDGQISNNYAKEYGGGIQAYDANVTVNGGTITGNKSGTAGGGLAIRNTASLTMNTSTTGGSGIVFENESVNGGAVFVSGATAKAEINGGAIGAGNTATNGGGIYANDSATVTMTGGNVDGNTATNGGGIYANDSATVTMTDGNVDGNTAANNGGGIYVEKSATVTVTGGNVDGNTAANDGGGIYVFQATANINGGTISSNTAATSGGGACVRGGATLTMSDGSIVGNTATSGSGGGIFVTPSDGTVQIVPQDGITTLNVAVWQRGGTSARITAENQAAIESGFIEYLEAVGYDTSVLKIKYYTITDSTVAAATTTIKNNYPTGLDLVVGGGDNIYQYLNTNTDYDLPLTSSMSSSARTPYVIKSTYQTGGTDRNVALLASNVGGLSDLAELFYRFIVSNSSYSCEAANIKTKYSHLTPTTVSTIIGGSSATISGGNVSNNSANVNGGGICVTGDSTFVMNGGNVTANTAKTGNGGGIYTDAGVSGYKVPSDGNTTLKVIAFPNQKTSTSYMTTADIDELRNAFTAYLTNSGYSIGTGDGQINFVLDVNTALTTTANVASAMVGSHATYDYSDYHILIGVGKNAVNNYDKKGFTPIKYTEMADTFSTGAGRYIGQNISTILSEAFYTLTVNGSIAADTTPAPAGGNAVTLTAGNIAGNSALNGNGGGVCCDNGSAVKLNASADNKSYPVIDGNSAKNGGGIAVINGGDVTMQGGYVTNNNAIGKSTGKTTDGYITNYLQFTGNGGVGGGIYVANPYGDNTKGEAKFTIENYKNINSGIYHNNAEFAADDLYANAVNTLISVPAFGDMKIKDDAGNVTGWYEDYATNEPRYTVGLNGNKQDKSEYPIERYDKSESDKVFEAWVDSADEAADQDEQRISDPDRYINGSNFVCVTLGAYVVYDGNMTIIKDIDGTVDPEQVFIFHVQRTHDQYGNPTADGDVNLFVTINGEGSVTIHSLPLGTYEVTELTDWSWRYNVQSTSVRVANESGNYVAGTDENDATDIVEVKLEPADDKGACNNPELTFVNVIPSNTPWLDGNSPKVVNTAGATTATSTTVGGQNTGVNVAKTVVYANFKREETLI